MITDEKLQELFLAGNFGQRLFIKRKKLNLSRTDFAKKLNVSSNTLAKYEKSEATPSPHRIREILEILDINIEDFLTERHQHILDVRFLLKDELKFINQRIHELEQLVRYYEVEKQDVQELLDEECSFATEFEDVEVKYQFSGDKPWMSEKLYLTKGIYVFEAETDTPGYTTLNLYDIVENTERSVFYENISSNLKVPFILENTGYFLLYLKRVKGNWKINFHKEIVNN